ncbi:MAG TPA: RodZ domain-containing protein, partial [Casimicrobiaceae bacterium]|nr:RodZ domain-containing protein [Casimicrobiaceae bacterium]
NIDARFGRYSCRRLDVAGKWDPVMRRYLLGNAHVVTLVYRGTPVDLSPYTRQNVARPTLQ